MAQYKYVNPKSLIAKKSTKVEVDKDVFLFYVANNKSVSFLSRGLAGDRVDIPLNGMIPELAVKKWYKQQNS